MFYNISNLVHPNDCHCHLICIEKVSNFSIEKVTNFSIDYGESALMPVLFEAGQPGCCCWSCISSALRPHQLVSQ